MYRIITIHFFCLTSNNKVRLIAVSSLKKRFLMATFHFRLTVLSYSMQTCFILILLTLICHLVNYCDKKHYFLFYHIITIDFFCLTSKSKVRLIVISSLEKKKRKAIFLMATSHSRPTFLTWLLYVNIFHFATFGFNQPFSNLLQQKQFILNRI